MPSRRSRRTGANPDPTPAAPSPGEDPPASVQPAAAECPAGWWPALTWLNRELTQAGTPAAAFGALGSALRALSVEVAGGLVYLFDGDGRHARLMLATGSPRVTPMAPECLAVEGNELWHAAAIREGRGTQVGIDREIWPEGPQGRCVISVPIAGCAGEPPAGFLAVAAAVDSPPDGIMKEQVELLAGLVAGALARLRERDRQRESREQEGHGQFLTELDRVLAQPADEEALLRAAVRLLGRHLHLQRCAWFEPSPAAATGRWLAEWAASAQMPRLANRPEMLDVAWLERVGDKPLITNDVLEHPATVEASSRYLSLGVRAFCLVPQVRDGRTEAVLWAAADHVRRWSEAEVALVVEVAQRVRVATQHVRASAAQQASLRDAAVLRESEQRLRSLADHAPMIMWATEADGRCSYLNAAWYEFTGSAPEATPGAAGLGWMDAAHPDDVEEAKRQLSLAHAAAASFRIEYRLQRHDGVYRWVLNAASARLGPGGEFLGLVGSIIDITDRKNSELSAAARADRLRLALASSNSGDWSWDAASDLVTLSPRAADIFGIAPGPVVTWTALRGLLDPQDADRARRAIEIALVSRSDYDIEFRITRPSGGVSWVAARGRGVYSDDQRVLGMIGVLQEINGRKRAEQALLDREQRLNQLISLMPAGTYACDARGRITFCNKQAIELWGREPQLNSDTERFTGAIRVYLLDGTLLPPDQTPMALAIREGRSVRNFEVMVERPDGGRWVASLNIDPLRDATGAVTGAINVFLDITERKRSEHLIAGQNRALELLAAGAPLGEILTTLVATVQRTAGAAFGSIILVDTTGRRLSVGAAPGLPAAYLEAIEGLEVGSRMGTCARAIASGETVITPDVAADPAWEQTGSSLSAAGLQAAWSMPIRGAGEAVLGAIGAFLREKRSPTVREREVVATLARAAAIAIERRRAEEAAQAAEAQLRLVTDSAPVMLMQCDFQQRVTFANRAYLERTGQLLDEVVGHPVQDVWDPENFARIRPYVDLVLAGVRVDFEHELQFPRIGARVLSVSFVPDRAPDGTVRGWVSASSDITENKRADAATRQLAAIVESTDDAIISKDLDGRITSWNLGAERLFGYSAPEMIGEHMLRIVPSDRTDEELEILARIRRGEHLAHYETVRQHKNGSVIDVSLTLSPIRDARRRTLGVSTIARDITGQKRQAAELRRREQLYRAIGESINYGIWVCDAEGRSLYTSESFLRLAGVTQEQCAGYGWCDLLKPDEREATRAAWLECVRSGTFWEREHTVRGADGRWHPILARGVPIRDDSGRITSWAGINLDVQAFKDAQETIREGELRFRAMADNIAQFAWMAEGDGRVFWFNQRWIDYTGVTVDGAPGYVHLRVVHPDYRAKAIEKYEQAIRESRGWEDTFPLRGRDGAYRWCLARAVPIRDEVSQALRWFGTATDVTDLRHAQDVLRQRSRTLETLNRVGNALVAELDLERIVQTVTEAGRDISGAAFGAFIEHPSQLVQPVIAMDAARREALERFGLPYNSDLFEVTFRGEPALRIADLHLDPRVPAATAGQSAQRLSTSVRSYLAVPVISRSGEVLGGLFFGHPEPGVFTEAAQNILTGLAAQTAIAIDNANLYAALQRELAQQKRADAALRASEHQLRLVTDHAPVFLVLCDRDHRYKFVNRPYANRHGREPYELIGLHIADVIGTKAYEIVRGQIESALAGHQEHFETEVPYEGLGKRWMEVVYVPERGAAGEVVGFVAVMSDITGRKQVEHEIEIARDRALAASRAKDDFLAALSHELRTPLNPVLLLASEAADDPQLSAEVRAAFSTIRNNVELEARLIDDLLDLTRIVRGKLPLLMRSQDAHAILQAALATIRAEIAQKRINLVLDLSAATADVWGDAVRLQQIFWNVLKNAVKFTPVEGRITVSTCHDPSRRRLCVRVADTGIGMTDAELSRIFDAFAQGDHAGGGGSHLFGGIGLGLAISQMLVEQHDGVIRAESAGRNQGSAFTIELPLAAASSQEATTAPVAPSVAVSEAPPETFEARGTRIGAGRILLVEDHEATRLTLAHLLARRRFDVVCAGSLAEARAEAEQGPFDVLISDIGLPDGSGYDLMMELSARWPLKGIALSGYGMEEDVARSRQAGFQQHLTKPVRVQSLDRALADLI